MAVHFDPEKLEVTGGAVPVVEGVAQRVAPLYAVSASGTLVYVPGAVSANLPGRSLVWVDRSGKEEEIPASRNEYMYPKISPDGTRVALTLQTEGNYDIWIWDFIRKTLTRLTFHKEADVEPIWTHDSKRIIFCSTRDGNLALYWKAADGTGKDEKLISIADRGIIPYSMSSDGKTLLSSEVEGNPMGSVKWDIGMVSMEGKPSWKPLLREEYTETQPQMSPDGKWMAYCSNESTGSQVYVRPFPEVDKGKWQVSTSGGTCPRWSPDGKELLYLSMDNSMMVVPVESGEIGLIS